MSKIQYIGFLLLVMMLASCHKAKGVFTDELNNGCRLYDYYEDSYGNGGIVAEIVTPADNKGTSILVLSLDEAALPWGPTEERVYRERVSSGGTAISSFGIAMLQIMRSMGISRFPAQEWCDQKNKQETYVRGGSWHLPTVYDLELIFGNSGRKVDSLNTALLKAGGVPVAKNALYWTCVEDIDSLWTFSGMENTFDPENRAVPINYQAKSFTNKDRWLKKNRYNVRAVKCIYYEYKKE